MHRDNGGRGRVSSKPGFLPANSKFIILILNIFHYPLKKMDLKLPSLAGVQPGGSREFEAGMASARIRKQLLN